MSSTSPQPPVNVSGSLFTKYYLTKYYVSFNIENIENIKILYSHNHQSMRLSHFFLQNIREKSIKLISQPEILRIYFPSYFLRFSYACWRRVALLQCQVLLKCQKCENICPCVVIQNNKTFTKKPQSLFFRFWPGASTKAWYGGTRKILKIDLHQLSAL